jgi:hypothetical protein
VEHRGEGVPPLRVAGILPAMRGQDALAAEDAAKMAATQTPYDVTTNGSHILSLVAGERPQAWPGEGETELLSLSGDALEWKGRPAEMPPFPRTGVYLATTGDQKRCISVRASPKEGEYRFVESSNVPILGSIPHTVVPFETGANYAQYHAGQARVTELYIPLLLLSTLAVFVEGLLGASRIRSTGGRAFPLAQSRRAGIHNLPLLLGRHV